MLKAINMSLAILGMGLFLNNPVFAEFKSLQKKKTWIPSEGTFPQNPTAHHEALPFQRPDAHLLTHTAALPGKLAVNIWRPVPLADTAGAQQLSLSAFFPSKYVFPINFIRRSSHLLKNFCACSFM